MATNFPTSLDTGSTLPNPTGSNTQNNPDHASLHGNENGAIIAIETKVGTGSSTPAANTLLFGTGSGTSAWQGLTSAQLISILSDETGTGSAVFATTPTLVTPKVDTINENTPANGVTIDGLNIKDNKLNTNNSVVTANITDSAVTSAKAATGFVVQVVNALTTANSTGTTTIPLDNTIPQNTEGDQYISLAITPKSTTNILVIEVNALVSTSVNTVNAIGAIFQDSTANALAADTGFNSTATAPIKLVIVHTMTAGTISATTFKFRAGCSTAATLTFNSCSGIGANLFGAISKSSMVITEYKA
jgi:hypothetical protein